LKDPTVFACVAVEEWGGGVTWDGEGLLSLAATTLYRLACEQAGDAARLFDAWMMRHGLSATAAAQALGMTRRTVVHYRTGSRPVTQGGRPGLQRLGSQPQWRHSPLSLRE